MTGLLDTQALAAHRQRNTMQTGALLAALAVVLGTAGYILAGPGGLMGVGLAIACLVVVSSKVPSEAMMRLYRAKRLPHDDGQLSSLVDVLAYRAGLPVRPDLYVIPSMTLNAFAAGSPEHAAIGVTEGLLRRLTLRETAGVLAHEMSHIRNNDLAVMGLADVITRVLQVFSYFAMALAFMNLLAIFTDEEPLPWLAILLLYLAPAASSLLQLGLSRAREFDADLEAAAMTGDPVGLAAALRRLETYTGRFWEDLKFPVPVRRVPQPSLLRTHPPAEDRIARLLELGGAPAPDRIVIVEQPMMSMVGLGPGDMRPRYRWPGLWF